MAGNPNSNDLVVFSISAGEDGYMDIVNANVEQNRISNSNKWIVDSGATCHMTSKLEMLYSVSNSNKNVGRKVYLPNGQTTSVTHSGNCKISADDVLENVLVVPNFKYNLLSVSKLTRQLNCSVHFFPECCIFQDLFNGEVKEIGKEKDGLYYFPSNISYAKIAASTDKILMTKTGDSECMLWHNRMGHPSFKTLKLLCLVNQDTTICDICSVFPLAKQTRIPFPISTSRTENVFDLVHLDVWGPYRTPTHNGFRYFLTIVDDHSRMVWLYMLRFKSDVFGVLKSFLALVKNQFNRQVKKVRSDNGTEFFNKDCCTLFTSFGIIHESSCPHTPQ